MDINIVAKIINTLGLLFDIIGACFVAWEVVIQFNGKKIDKDPSIYAADEPPFETEEYKKWEKRRYKFMKIGLFFLIVGFILQISSVWLPCFSSNTKNNNTQIIRPIKPATLVNGTQSAPPNIKAKQDTTRKNRDK